MKNTFKDIIKPILVLTCICLVVTGLLAYVNMVTSPIIEKAELDKSQQAMSEVLPEADSFTAVDINKLSDIPEEVSEIHKADNGAGYVFILITKGYGGDMKIACGINSEGTVEACTTLSHSETSGLGSKTAEDPYKSQYTGKSADTLNEVEAITGATISSNAYMSAIENGFKAYEIVKEAE